MNDRGTAIEFTASPRGQLIMAQALDIAIEALESVDKERQEVSNISDMRYLRDNLFTFPLTFSRSGITPIVTGVVTNEGAMQVSKF